MAKKKDTHIHVSEEDTAQVQEMLEQYHQLAHDLQSVTSREQAEAALTGINARPEAAQMALLMALSKENSTDAADVLLAIYELSPTKSIRKEARRSLIRLEGARIYPRWRPPAEAPLIQLIPSNPPRFWKGLVTDTIESGEAQLLLCWEQGDDYKETRVLGFLLEFWHDGVKDFFTRVESKRSVDNLIAQLKSPSLDVEIVDCPLARGRRLILDALDVNQRTGTLLPADYRRHLSLVKQLVLDAPDLDEEEEEEEEMEQRVISHDWSPAEVVSNFVEAWVDGDYEFAYDLLASDSHLRAGLSRDEWTERRDAWADEAYPGDLKPNFLFEREAQKSGLWLPIPFSVSRATTHKEIEIGWSVELDETALSDTLPEFPKATASYEETGRHWFWTSYTLVKENDEWRIQSMTDEGANALGLPLAELQKRIEEHNKRVEDITRKHKPTDPDAERYLKEIIRHVMQISYYEDALLKYLPLDRSIYELAAARMILFREYERSLVYLEPLAQRFPERRGEILQQLAAVQIQLSESYFDDEDDERADQFQELAESTLRESLNVESTALGHMILAELLMEQDDRLDEAEEHLQQAKALATSPSEEDTIEIRLGEVAMEREQYKQALSHFQHAAEIDPGRVEAWYKIGGAHHALGNFEEAETNYKRAIGLQPDDINGYSSLSRMFFENDQLERAREVLEEGLRNNPDSADLHAYLASVLSQAGEHSRAEELLDEAERLDPDLQALTVFRQMLSLNKLKQTSPVNKPKQISNVKTRRKR